jgi:hypothetical protein
MSTKGNREIWYSAKAIIFVTALYLFVLIIYREIPPASDFFGHTIGILGFILMLMTETLYSLRKRSRNARLGRMSNWLDFHIFTGLVGPYMVLLHSSWKFNGLAGIVLLLTIIIVGSGIFGRYIYTLVPRTTDGAIVEAELLEKQIAIADAEIRQEMEHQSPTTAALFSRLIVKEKPSNGFLATFVDRTLTDPAHRLQWCLEKARLDKKTRSKVDQLDKQLRRRHQLTRQLNSLALARRTLALWHSVHIPIGMVLFTAATIHIFAAIYYATLLR